MRSAIHLASTLLVSLGLAACAHGAPPGFSEGSSWSMPLVSPLERGPLLVPVEVDGHGPYLFAIDPLAPATSIDRAIADELDVYRLGNVAVIDETDTARTHLSGQVRRLRVGDLRIDADRRVVIESG